MRSARFPFQQALAAALPPTFIWLFIACVSMCSMHHAEAEQGGEIGLINTLVAPAEEDCCPMTGTTVSTAPERTTLFSPATDRHPAPPTLLTHPAGTGLARAPATSLYPDDTSPPRERRGVLRI